MVNLIDQGVCEIEAAVHEVGMLNPLFLSTTDKMWTLEHVAQVEAQLAVVRLQALAAADDVKSEAGSAAWNLYAHRERQCDINKQLRLARSLDEYKVMCEALTVGRISVEQALVIVKVLDEMPAEVRGEWVGQAEVSLVEFADRFDPTQLWRLGKKIMSILAPAIADEIEAKALAKMEDEARHATQLVMRANGDGTTSFRGTVPDQIAARFAGIIDAYVNPRREHLAKNNVSMGRLSEDAVEGTPGYLEGPRLPFPKRAGKAFCEFMENVDPTTLPIHGGDATTLVVTISLESLIKDLATATLITPGPGDSGDQITADEARRLACNAGIVPIVLGGEGQILDLGRKARLYDANQRLAMAVRDKTCRMAGCSVSADRCEAHHLLPWSQGGQTDLEDGVLFCTRDHHRAHDPRFELFKLPDGQYELRRRCRFGQRG